MLKLILFITLLLAYIINTVSAADCCGIFNTDCCGKCTGGQYDGQECTIQGNPHDLTCEPQDGHPSCTSGYDTQGCNDGW
ncbi:uncharacterized protein BX664DRAFT_342424, partial [Halteromyces radiatus]|uniref:uncharacterized protein n=1 Tax=Halteromyces radiatus TaxID=101107 RepID=UPI00221EC974